jgi:hypothetical protein
VCGITDKIKKGNIMNVTKKIIKEIGNYNPTNKVDVFKRMDKLLKIVKKNQEHIDSQDLHQGIDFLQFHVHFNDGYTFIIHFDELNPKKPRLTTCVLETDPKMSKQLINVYELDKLKN